MTKDGGGVDRITQLFR